MNLPDQAATASQASKGNELLHLPTSISIPEGELWWGGCAADGIQMPFEGSRSHRSRLAEDHRGNQAAPLLISSKGRYLWSDEPFTFQFGGGRLELSGSMRAVSLSYGHDSLRGAFHAASRRHFPTFGKLPPDVFFTQPQYNTWIELTHGQSQEGVLRYAKELITAGFPPGLLMIDAGWEEYWGKLDFARGRFPAPAEMVKELKSMGFHVLLWVSPFVSADSAEFRAWRNLPGMLLRWADTRPAVLEWWDGHSAHLDLTDPAAIDWFSGRLEFLKRAFGVDGFKFDAGDTQHYRHRPHSLLNASPVELTECWTKLGLKHPFNEFRACWKMGGTPLIQRLSDRLPNWGDHGLASLIPNGLAQGLIGHAFVCPDMIGGGEYLAFRELKNGIDEELFIRSAQVSALFPMMQFSASPARVLSDEARKLCLEAIRLHRELAPLLLQVALESAQTGMPMIRPLEWEFPHSGYANVRDQFLIGDRVLAAPVLEQGADSRKVVFPPGEWRGTGGQRISGPCVREEPVTLSSVPLFYRGS